ncbi:hypothetical protein [Thermophagus xiamenensis]|uniref:hypothetical protein n=1 Tax=Thermophagus xiamenensis TaxID=385682 RepID=UPI0002D9FE73|nr:hypothetical protein [Thermophagus xiamenensis]
MTCACRKMVWRWRTSEASCLPAVLQPPAGRHNVAAGRLHSLAGAQIFRQEAVILRQHLNKLWQDRHYIARSNQ